MTASVRINLDIWNSSLVKGVIAVPSAEETPNASRVPAQSNFDSRAVESTTCRRKDAVFSRAFLDLGAPNLFARFIFHQRHPAYKQY
jgi:hypothetical protein